MSHYVVIKFPCPNCEKYLEFGTWNDASPEYVKYREQYRLERHRRFCKKPATKFTGFDGIPDWTEKDSQIANLKAEIAQWTRDFESVCDVRDAYATYVCGREAAIALNIPAPAPDPDLGLDRKSLIGQLKQLRHHLKCARAEAAKYQGLYARSKNDLSTQHGIVASQAATIVLRQNRVSEVRALIERFIANLSQWPVALALPISTVKNDLKFILEKL